MSHPGQALALASPLLDHCPPTLPARAYFDRSWYAVEHERIWKREWIHVGRRADLGPGTMRPVVVAGQPLLLVHSEDGTLAAFRNTCRHRGAELCGVEQKLRGRRITCPYHQWTYDLGGRLVSTGYATPTADFRREEHGLLRVHLEQWRGFLFVCLADDPPDFAEAPDVGVDVLTNWPLEHLVCGHRRETTLECNWKIFWENYSECLHCPGIHPGLSALVPLYSKGVMAANEAPGWEPGMAAGTTLREGARTWTVSGRPCGPEFPDLSDEERATGMHFVTFWPTMFVCAHVDYARVITVVPDGPERTRLCAEWLFPRTTLDAPGFDLGDVVEFAGTVLREDGEACEMNQRGPPVGRVSRRPPDAAGVRDLPLSPMATGTASGRGGCDLALTVPLAEDQRAVLPAWAYRSAALLELEKKEVFATHWQLAGHVSDIPEGGDFLAFDFADERALILRDDDGAIRALHNLCRHRGARVVAGASDRCRSALVCPFHGWVYNLDGSLRGPARPSSFGVMDRSRSA
jgi:Rieske 2Fe-2S family protein